jgi:phospholipid-transporting ATPase
LIREYQPKATVLAVGDGINDTNMMNAAHIAVSINGNQAASSSLGGNHALRNSDYALGQFKHLRTLLLCHGRESYRKNSYVILYIFYKNLLFSVPLFLYGIYSGFSGMNTYEIWMAQLFNVAFTSLPIIFYGVLD